MHSWTCTHTDKRNTEWKAKVYDSKIFHHKFRNCLPEILIYMNTIQAPHINHHQLKCVSDSFICAGPHSWLNLPIQLKQCRTEQTFKTNLKKEIVYFTILKTNSDLRIFWVWAGIPGCRTIKYVFIMQYLTTKDLYMPWVTQSLINVEDYRE